MARIGTKKDLQLCFEYILYLWINFTTSIQNMICRQKYRLYPTREQEKLLQWGFGFARWVYNFWLENKIEAHKKWEKLSAYDLDKIIAKKKKEEWFEWMWSYTKWIRQFALNNLDTAFQNFFRKQNQFPKFKSRKSNKSYSCLDIKIKEWKIQIPRIWLVKIVLHRNIIWKIWTATISQTPTWKYYISIVVDDWKELPTKIIPTKENTLWLDMWIKDFVITSEWAKYSNPKYMKQKQRRLEIRQRRLSKKTKGSNNKNKQRLLVAKIYEKIANQRLDYIHQITSQLIKSESQAFALEDLNIGGMLKNHKLANAISQVWRGMFKDILTYKCERYWKTILTIWRFEPSSKMCCKCWNIKQDLTLKDRIYKCGKCWVEYDRDIGASKNIRDFAFKQ